MNSGAKDKAQGKARETKGRIKEAAGKMTGRPDLEQKGTEEKIAGKVQHKIGQIKNVFGK
jgi:uncharacterized protein YjbJ (UPF0337 family)